jgi:hypothetical protein
MIWKNIPGYESLYQISDTTIVKRIIGKSCLKERIIQPHKRKDGYLYVTLYKNRKRKHLTIHRLMLESFVCPRPKGKEGCHNDGNKDNNFIPNLRWDTRSENQKDSIRHGTHFSLEKGQRCLFAKLNELQVRIIKHLLKEGILFQREIAKIFNVSRKCISAIKNNQTWKHVSIN